MYNIIQMTNPNAFVESFDLNVPGKEQIDFYTEAVFADGKKTVEPILNAIKICRDILLEEIKKVDDTAKAHKGNKSIEVYKFDPNKYWKNQCWKDLEDSIMKVFGFRYCEINPYIEKYIKSINDFESRELNCMVYHPDRYPIEGLVTDKGYYDKSHSSTMLIYITLGLIKDLEPDEILAVLLHEFGHSIDPALTTISYSTTNILSKYLTDRTGKLTDDERKVLEDTKKKHKLSGEVIGDIIILAIFFAPFIIGGLKSLFNIIREKIIGKERVEEEKIDKIKRVIAKEKDDFNRREFSEAFADNFARMYGYGAILAKGLQKLSKHTEKIMNSWYKKDRKRRDCIVRMTMDAIGDEHKTDIHRIHSLIKEYKADINDPKTPPTVKKYLEADLKELEEVLKLYTNDFSDFQNRVNQAIYDELIKKDNKKEKAIKESTDIEERTAWDRNMEDIMSDDNCSEYERSKRIQKMIPNGSLDDIPNKDYTSKNVRQFIRSMEMDPNHADKYAANADVFKNRGKEEKERLKKAIGISESDDIMNMEIEESYDESFFDKFKKVEPTNPSAKVNNGFTVNNNMNNNTSNKPNNYKIIQDLYNYRSSRKEAINKANDIKREYKRIAESIKLYGAAISNNRELEELYKKVVDAIDSPYSNNLDSAINDYNEYYRNNSKMANGYGSINTDIESKLKDLRNRCYDVTKQNEDMILKDVPKLLSVYGIGESQIKEILFSLMNGSDSSFEAIIKKYIEK